MKVAVLGFGTVGVGVWDMLEKAPGLERGLVLVRPGKENETYKVSSMEAICNDASIDTVAEVMGGVEPAFTYVSMALKAGKHVVTSNKALVAAKGIELNKLARENNVSFLFSAACGGAVPFLHNLSLAALDDEIESLGGILNGTTNFMLDSMQSEGMDYAEALAIAQKLGYAEADPTADVSGMDALRKIMLACAVAYDKLPVDGFAREGIESITAADVDDFKTMGLTARLVTSGGMVGDKLYAYVEPVLFSAGAAECSVLKNFNMAKYMGKNSGSIVYIGQGAGRYPTASALIRDMYCIGGAPMFTDKVEEVVADNSAAVHGYYVRCSKADAAAFDFESCREDGELVRGIVKPCAVTQMHAAAKAIRDNGGKIFFAAMEK